MFALLQTFAAGLSQRPVNEVIILISYSAVITFIMISCLILLVTKISKLSVKEIVKLIISFFKKKPEKTEPTVTVNINNASNSAFDEDDLKEENELLDRINSASDDLTQKVLSKVSEDAACDDADVLIIISKSVRFGSEMARFKEISLIKSQMTAAETRTDMIEGMLIKEYMEAIYEIRGSNVNIQDDQSYRIFEEIVHHQTHKNILSVLRRVFKDNHLVSYDDEGYTEYVGNQCEFMLMSIRLSINSSIPSFISPGREDINKILDEKNKAILSTFKSIFMEARDQAFRTEQIIIRKEKEFDEEIKRLTGIHNAHTKADSQNIDPYGKRYTDNDRRRS